MTDLTTNEVKILNIAYNKGKISINDFLKIYRSKTYANEILRFLTANKLLKIAEYGYFTLTIQGKEAIGKA